MPASKEFAWTDIIAEASIYVKSLLERTTSPVGAGLFQPIYKTVGVGCYCPVRLQRQYGEFLAQTPALDVLPAQQGGHDGAAGKTRQLGAKPTEVVVLGAA
jgi:hypothetical protein